MEKVYIKKIEDYDLEKLKEFVRETFIKLNIKIKKNSSVLVKPNLILAKSGDSAVITNPIIIKAVLEVLLEKNVKPFIYEIPSIHPIDYVAKECGLDIICKELKVNIQKKGKFGFLTLDNNKYFKRLPIPAEVKKADFIINLAKLKTHTLTGLTLGVKNLFGLIKSNYRNQMHFKTGRDTDYFADIIIDVHNFIKPNLTIIDGIIGMEGNGPSNGIKRNFNLIAASTNTFAIDTAITNILNVNLNEIPIQKNAKIRGIYGSKLEDIELIGDKILLSKPIKMPNTYKTSFKLLNSILNIFYPTFKGFFISRPKINEKKCISCFNCKKICPANAISIKNNKPKICYKKCIKCFCCHEVCPENAINIYSPYLGYILEKIIKRDSK